MFKAGVPGGCQAAGPGHGLACVARRRLKTRHSARCGVAAAADLGTAPFQPQIRTLPARSRDLVAGRPTGSATHLGHRCCDAPNLRERGITLNPGRLLLLEIQK
jgi:hypothetical protein